MKPESQKLRHETEEKIIEVQHAQSGEKGRVFGSVEELLRFDASQNPPTPALGERVNESIANEPKARRSWWQRLFNRG